MIADNKTMLVCSYFVIFSYNSWTLSCIAVGKMKIRKKDAERTFYFPKILCRTELDPQVDIQELNTKQRHKKRSSTSALHHAFLSSVDVLVDDVSHAALSYSLDFMTLSAIYDPSCR